MRIRSIIDDKKKQRVRDAIANDDPTLLWPKKKAEPEPAVKMQAKALLDPEQQKRLDKELLLAVKNSQSELVKDLVNKGANVDIRDENDWTLLMVASNYCLTNIVKILVANGADANLKESDTQDTALALAVFHNSREIAEILIVDGKANVNDKNKNGCTPLMVAAIGGYTDIAEMLIGKGAQVNARTMDGTTALGFAELNFRSRTAEMLRNHGAIL